MKNTLEGIKSRPDEAEYQTGKLEDKVEKNTQSEQQNEKRLEKNEDSLRGHWDNMKYNRITPYGYQENKGNDG